MIITSFFPGRIRLRAPIFKDEELFLQAKNIVSRFLQEADVQIENNFFTGSILIQYNAKKLSDEKMKKILSLKETGKKLNKIAEHYTPNDKETVKKMLSEIDSTLI